MAEYVDVSFRIGGRIKRTDLQGLIYLYNERCCLTSLDASGTEHAPATKENIGATFDGESTYGNLDDLEVFCKLRSIDYEGSRGGGSWGAGTIYKCVGGEYQSFSDDGDGNACIPIKDLVTPEALATGWGPLIQRIRRFLEPLPEVEIVDD